MKRILIVAQFAPTFGGNFIESMKSSMKSLQEAEEISVRYLLPEQAKSCEWISDLTEVHYTDWSFPVIRISALSMHLCTPTSKSASWSTTGRQRRLSDGSSWSMAAVSSAFRRFTALSTQDC